MGVVAYTARPRGVEVDTAHGYVALLTAPPFPVIVAPRRLYLVFSREIPLVIGGFLFDAATGAMLYDSVTGAALYA